MIMDVNGREFRVIRLLGKGKGGYSYLVENEEGRFVLKQIHHEPCDYYTFGDKLASELRDYDRLQAVGIPMPKLMDVDHNQERILKTFIDGPTVLDLVLQDRLEDSHFVQVRSMCEVLMQEGLNIDYFPTNFVEEQGKLYYIDYECNQYMQQWDFEHWGIRYWSKTPELMAYAADHHMV
jgi:tRNA A-37 threonylcarbamoyl transferase component Bud32